MDSTVSLNAVRRPRTLQARGPAGGLAVTSDLDAREPVTDAEIALVLGMLGDTIARLLNPPRDECLTSDQKNSA